ncbi:MAG: hypothetical protein GXO47_07560 [Chlorobi bacterium]|nr:hypothetical protein [Chlorobiota bacterium]
MKAVSIYIKPVVFAVALWILNVLIAYYTGNDIEKISLMVFLLSGLFFLFNVVFSGLSVRRGKTYLLYYVVLSVVKIIIVLWLAWYFLFFNRSSSKAEALFFLFDYFLLFIFDVQMRIRTLNKNNN